MANSLVGDRDVNPIPSRPSRSLQPVNQKQVNKLLYEIEINLWDKKRKFLEVIKNDLKKDLDYIIDSKRYNYEIFQFKRERYVGMGRWANIKNII